MCKSTQTISATGPGNIDYVSYGTHSTLFLVDGGTLRAYDVSDPTTSLPLVNSLSIASCPAATSVKAHPAGIDTVYVYNQCGGYVPVDITTPSSMVLKSLVPSPAGTAIDLGISTTTVYALLTTGSAQAVAGWDTSNRLAPTYLNDSYTVGNSTTGLNAARVNAFQVAGLPDEVFLTGTPYVEGESALIILNHSRSPTSKFQALASGPSGVDGFVYPVLSNLLYTVTLPPASSTPEVDVLTISGSTTTQGAVLSNAGTLSGPIASGWQSVFIATPTGIASYGTPTLTAPYLAGVQSTTSPVTGIVSFRDKYNAPYVAYSLAAQNQVIVCKL